MNSNTSLVLRVCRPDGTSRDGFQWPMKVGAEVVAPDWKNNTECGNGLHGWLYGQGDYGCVLYWEDDEAKWLVLEVESDSIVLLGGNCKFPRAVVRFVGTRAAAADYIIVNEPRAHSSTVIGACLKAGEGEVVQVGSLGTAMAGDYGKALLAASARPRLDSTARPRLATRENPPLAFTARPLPAFTAKFASSGGTTRRSVIASQSPTWARTVSNRTSPTSWTTTTIL